MATITLHGKPMQTAGELPAMGSPAIDFNLTKMDLTELTLKECLGNTIILNIFPSVDTETCSLSVQHFNRMAATLKDTVILCVSADLPFAFKRFCGAKDIKNVTPVSIFRHPDFGLNYGITITEGPLQALLSRAVVIIDPKGKIKYTQQVTELSNEPNYEHVLTALTSQ